MRGLKEHVAIVTGGGNGIGAAICERLVEEGTRVVVSDINSDAAEAIVSKLVAKACDQKVAAAFVGDVTDPTFAQRSVEFALEQFGDLHHIVANAGVTRDQFFHKIDWNDWNRTLALHVTAPAQLAQASWLYWRGIKDAPGGETPRSILFTSSVSAWGNPGQSAYATAKSAIVGLTRSLAKEASTVGMRHVRVNAVAYGFIQTRMTQLGRQDFMVGGEAITMGLPDRVHEAVKASIPMGRMGLPEECAAGAAFLLSQDASYITGKVLQINGGQLVV